MDSILVSDLSICSLAEKKNRLKIKVLLGTINQIRKRDRDRDIKKVKEERKENTEKIERKVRERGRESVCQKHLSL